MPDASCAGSLTRVVGQYEPTLHPGSSTTAVGGGYRLCPSLFTPQVGPEVPRRRTAGVWFHYCLPRHRFCGGCCVRWFGFAWAVLVPEALSTFHNIHRFSLVSRVHRGSYLWRSECEIPGYAAQQSGSRQGRDCASVCNRMS